MNICLHFTCYFLITTVVMNTLIYITSPKNTKASFFCAEHTINESAEHKQYGFTCCFRRV